jgi:hypothetical protein
VVIVAVVMMSCVVVADDIDVALLTNSTIELGCCKMLAGVELSWVYPNLSNDPNEERKNKTILLFN